MAEPSLPRGPAIDVWLSGMPDLPQVVEDNPPFLSSESGRSPSPDREESHQPASLIHRLQHLDKPVLHLPLLGGREGAQQLPEDVRQLECDILEVSRYSKGIYPAEIRSEIEALSGCLPPPDFAYRNEEETREEKQKKDDDEGPRSFGWLRLSRLLFTDRPEASLRTRYALSELDKIRDLGRIARECRRLERCEAAWNAELHGPLLKLALSRQGRSGSVTYENATSARILSCFRPTFVTGDLWDLSGREEVDYVIAPRISPEVDAAIEERLLKAYMLAEPTAGAQAQDQLHVNQTGYPPLARSPTAISIAVTVGSADTEMTRLQLGIWTAAWHKRMEMLGVGGGKQGPPLPTLPLIFVYQHHWSLYFAVDRLDRIEICGPTEIGSSSNSLDIYRLVAVLETLGGWVDTVFRNWVTDTFSPHPGVTVDADADVDVT